ncbi:MAG: hypothetical protein Q8O25_01485 [Sulfurisoma sp.]|nr:hypothetical protein [Sulfurisoma sp.]
MLGQPGIDVGPLRIGIPVKPRVINTHAQRLGGEPDKRRAQAIHAGVTEYEETHFHFHFRASSGENLAPAVGADTVPQRHVGAGHDQAAFVELGQRVAQATATLARGGAARRHGQVVLAVESRLGLRKGQPHQRVVGVVPVVGTGLDFAVKPGAFLVGQRRAAGGDEAQRLAVAGRDAPLRRQRSQ